MNRLILNTSNGAYYQFNASNSLEQIAFPDEADIKDIFIVDHTVNIVSVVMPLKQDKQIEKALPFALEESISSDLEDTYIKYIGKKSDKAYAFIASKNLIGQFSKNDKIASVSYLPAFLPQTENGVTVVIIADTAMIHINKYMSFSIPVSMLEYSLASLTQDDESLKCIGICELTPNKKGEVDDLLLAQLQNLHLEITQLNPYAILDAINKVDTKKSTLLSGEFKRVQKKNTAKLNKFNGIVGLFISLLVITFLTAQIYKSQTDNKTTAIQAASVEFYKKLFPNEVVRERLMKRQFNDYIKSSSGSGQNKAVFTELLATTAKEVKTFKNIQFNSIKYSDKNHLLELSLTCSSVNELDQLKQKLSAKGLKVDIASANQSGGMVKGVIKVQSNG